MCLMCGVGGRSGQGGEGRRGDFYWIVRLSSTSSRACHLPQRPPPPCLAARVSVRPSRLSFRSTCCCGADLGAAYGTAKAGVGLASMGVMNPSLVMRNVLPVVMAGILGIYGLIVGAILNGRILPPSGGTPAYSSFEGYAHLGSGLACGLSALAAGLAIGIAGDAGVRAIGQIRDETNRGQMFTGMILVLIFGEALSLYGLIVSLVLSQKDAPGACT
jgi:V-type H+-transporting ATPase 16kDa proteolipid subunit